MRACLLFIVSVMAVFVVIDVFGSHKVTGVSLVSAHLYRGPRPSAMTDIKATINDLKVVVDLESGIYNDIHNDQYTRDIQHPADFGIKFITYPLSDVASPDTKKLEVIADTIHQAMLTKQVYVHCLYGDDRTGMVIAAWRMRYQYWSYEKARDEMFSMGFHHIYDYWLPALEAVGNYDGQITVQN